MKITLAQKAFLAALILPALALAETKSGGVESIYELSLASLLELNVKINTGTRQRDRTLFDSPSFVESLDITELKQRGISDLNEVLARHIPSYNVSTQPNSDASAFVRPAFMRGMAPDQTLVLINGKRFHRSSVVHLTTGSGAHARGTHGSNVADIPIIALKKVEVLHSGASAQYGSDAIAGVINFILREDQDGAEVNVQHGKFYEGESENIISANLGMNLFDSGFLNISAEVVQADELSRGVQNQNAIALIDESPNLDNVINDPAQIWGRPEEESSSLFWNAKTEIFNKGRFYTFGNYTENEFEGGFFYRPITGVVEGIGRTDVFGVGENGECLQLCELFPGGFTPRFKGRLNDFSQKLGYLGQYNTKLEYDLGLSFANNKIRFFVDNTVNPALGDQGENTKTGFRVGAQEQRDLELNIDFTYDFSDALKLALGAEWRRETYKITAGEEASWSGNEMLAAQGFAVGSNGAGGFLPSTAGTFDRDNSALYLDSEWDNGNRFFTTMAIRYEDFSDFGPTTNGQLGARYQLNQHVLFRGTLGTGYKAPTVGQANISQITTSFFENDMGNIVQAQTAILRVGDPISQIMGARDLEPETSTQISAGVMFTGSKMNIGFDFYQIEVEDRIGLTNQLTPTLTQREAIDALGRPVFYSQIRYFTNAFNTRTRGIDLSISRDLEQFGKLKLSYAWNNIEVTQADERVVNRENRLELEKGLPEHKAILAHQININKWDVLSRAIYYGEVLDASVNPDLDFIAGSETIFDFQVSYLFSKNYSVSLGAQNVFDEYPDEKSTEEGLVVAGLPYYRQSPVNYYGGVWYLRLDARF